jgi:hypothetical protein
MVHHIWNRLRTSSLAHFATASTNLKGTLLGKQCSRQRPSPKIDANQVAALLDHREPQRQVATAESLNSIASLGAPVGQAAHLSQSELYALRAKLISLWNPPEAVSAYPDKYVVSIRIRLARNHRLVGQPVVLTSGHGRCSKRRATAQCARFSRRSPTACFR